MKYSIRSRWKIGFTQLRNDWDIISANGAGSYAQATPSAENFQQVSQDLIGQVRFNPNTVESVDNRQTATYLITNLKENPYSIYQNLSDRDKPNNLNFFIDSNTQNYSGIKNKPVPLKILDKQKQPPNTVSVFPIKEDKNRLIYNPNQVIFHNIYGQYNPNIENPFLFQSPLCSAVFTGLGYPGSAISANDDVLKHYWILIHYNQVDI